MENSVILLCDIGNTSYHFLDSTHDYKENVSTFNPDSIERKVYYICVNPTISKVLESLHNWINIASMIDMKPYYKTMGIDRIVACEAIQNGVIIDAGSAITVDVVNNGIFEGGFICPGVAAMEMTYKNISSALDYSFNYEVDLENLPRNSQDAISYGFLKTLYCEVMSYEKNIYLTGGDAQKLLSVFKNAKHNNYLLFDGMKKIINKTR